MWNTLILLVILVIVAVVVFFVIKNFVKIAINSVLGLLILLFVNYFHLMSYLGKSDIAISWLSVIICAVGGILGAVLLILLHIAGIVV